MRGHSLPIRGLASIISDVANAAIEVRNTYLELFESCEGEDTRMYNSLHKNGTGIADDSDRNWIYEAQRTGEIFPGRPKIRPSLDIGTSSKRENARTCRKNYTELETCSLGIFMVQCVCSNPKIIGISVM